MLAEGFVHIYRLQVTPSRVYCYGPEVNVSNRICVIILKRLKTFYGCLLLMKNLGSYLQKIYRHGQLLRVRKLEVLHTLRLEDFVCRTPKSLKTSEIRSKLTNQYKKALSRRLDHRLAKGFDHSYRLQVSPCRVYFHGPEVNMSNRILHRYPEALENFLRVSFVEEEFGKLFIKDLSPREAFSSEEIRSQIYDKILRTLNAGIVIGNKREEVSQRVWPAFAIARTAAVRIIVQNKPSERDS
ncbi:hypothetical protein Vadar_003530 [Vaccinium darrowii]|uniref:Uncharacterized protein n=1 Tax=Vaccinium darrowii TaxID=229202 RepID=A0ACB7YTS6_9ERIC|nr:hypothetical protein Vadar_003530 [Vaccinium darrowii]